MLHISCQSLNLYRWRRSYFFLHTLFLRPAQECQKVFKASRPMDNDLVKGKVGSAWFYQVLLVTLTPNISISRSLYATRKTTDCQTLNNRLLNVTTYQWRNNFALARLVYLINLVSLPGPRFRFSSSGRGRSQTRQLGRCGYYSVRGLPGWMST